MASAIDAQPETTRVLRLKQLDGIESPVVCDVAIRHRAPNTAKFLPHGYYRRIPLLTTNTLSRLEPGDYELQLRDCEPATHRPVPARLRFHVPEPPTDYYAGSLPPLPASPSYEEIGPIKMAEQSQLRRTLASASATAAAVGPTVGSAVFTLLLTLLAVAAAALLMGSSGPDGSVKRAAEEEEQAAVALAKSGGTPAHSSSQGTQIASTEEEEHGGRAVPAEEEGGGGRALEVPNPAVELPKNDAEWREMFDKVYSSPSSAGCEEVVEAFAADQGGPMQEERVMAAELGAEIKKEEQEPEPQERVSASSASSSLSSSSATASAPKQRRGSSSVRLSPESVVVTGGAARPPSAFPIDEASVEGRGSCGRGEHRRQSLSWVEDYWGVPEGGEGVDEAETEQQGQQPQPQLEDATVAGVGVGGWKNGGIGVEEQEQGAEEQGVEEELTLERSVSARDHQQEEEGEATVPAVVAAVVAKGEGDKAASKEEGQEDQ